MSISTQPLNQSLAQPTKFRLSFSRLPHVTFFCQAVNLPGLTLTEVPRNTPFVDLYVPGEKLVYDQLNISFLVDEDYRSWFSVHDWIQALTFPEDFTQYLGMKTLNHQAKFSTNDKMSQYSDAALTIYTNQNNPNIRIKFVELFPTTLSSIQFNSQDSADNILMAEASFRFSYFTVERF